MFHGLTVLSNLGRQDKQQFLPRDYISISNAISGGLVYAPRGPFSMHLLRAGVLLLANVIVFTHDMHVC